VHAFYEEFLKTQSHTTTFMKSLVFLPSKQHFGSKSVQHMKSEHILQTFVAEFSSCAMEEAGVEE